MAIPLKRAPRPVMGYLETGEVQAVLDSIDRGRASGRRDYALVNSLYNTGARVQEVIDLKVGSIRFAAPPRVLTSAVNSVYHNRMVNKIYH